MNSRGTLFIHVTHPVVNGADFYSYACMCLECQVHLTAALPELVLEAGYVDVRERELVRCWTELASFCPHARKLVGSEPVDGVRAPDEGTPGADLATPDRGPTPRDR